jgi:FkbM family methyltransferase
MVKQCIDKVYYHSQYEIPGLVEIDKGDVVIDAGAFYGDSAIYFDSANSPGGTVYAFEPNKNIVTILRDNIRLNKTTNIVVVEKGLSDSDSIVKLTDTGETSVIFDANTVDTGSFMEIETTTIDNFVAINGLKKVNFIKMDIEGHEECAIKGGRETIKQFKPKLAISIYHRYYDVYDLPLLIREINPDYKFYIRHATNTWADTVLFCI